MARVKGFRTRHKKIFTWVVVTVGVLAAIVGLLAFVWHGFSMFNAMDYETNLYTEVFGVLFSIFVSVVIIGGWSYWRERQQLRARLKREAGSRSNDIAISAVEWLREEGWLVGEKGLLQGAELSSGNLSGANLKDANLQKSTLLDADLQDAELYYAKLQQAKLLQANLQGAKFYKANLTRAVLINADLTGASLLGANLTGTVFVGATMPDGEEYYEGMDLSKYRELKQDLLNQINAIRLGDGLYPITSVDDINDSLPMPKPVRLW